MEHWQYRETLRRCKTFRLILDKYASIPQQTDNLAFEMRTQDLISEHLRTYIKKMPQESEKFEKLIDHLLDPRYEMIETAFRFLLKQFTSDGYPDITEKLEQTLAEVSQLERPPDEPVYERVQRLQGNIDIELREIAKQIKAQIVQPRFDEVVNEQDTPPADPQDTEPTDESYMELMKAIACGDTKLVEDIVTTDPISVNTFNTDGENALILASKYSTVHIVQTLLRCDAVDVNMKDCSGRTAVMYAIARGDINVISALLDSDKVNTGLCDSEGLMCEYYSFGITMLKYAINPPFALYDQLKKDTHILEWNKITKVIECLLSKQNINQTNLISASIMFGNEVILPLVLQSSVPNINQNFILNIILTTNPILVKMLDRFQINLKDIDTTMINLIMRSVIRYNCSDTCAALLEQVTDLNVDNVMKTMLQLQCTKVGALSYTLKHTTHDLKEQTTQGETLLILACRYGSDELVSRLLEFLEQKYPGLRDVDHRDINGYGAFMWASICGRKWIAELIVEHSINRMELLLAE